MNADSEPNSTEGTASTPRASSETSAHTPISNLATESTAVGRRLVSPPAVGTAKEVAALAEGIEAIGGGVRAESATVATAPEAKLPDIGAASFADPALVLETVHGDDNRIRVENTGDYPWSANASLLITARDGSQWVGTAWFVSPRTLVTAAHCVYIKNSPVPGRDGWVKSIQVMPGRNGTELPYGSVTATRFWTVKGWADTGDENFDYGAIIVPSDIGTTVGVLGFGVYSDEQLDSAVVNVAGYPGDKPGTLWYDTKTVAATGPTKVHYDIDTAGGQSGAAVYLIEDGKRIGVAIHAYGGATTNSGTRISPPVFSNLSGWKT